VLLMLELLEFVPMFGQWCGVVVVPFGVVVVDDVVV
jgi:hypothetical protein